MRSFHYLALATVAFSLPSCSLFKKGEENYDTPGGEEGAYDTSNPYGVPGEASAESVPYQPVNPPADHPTYGQAAYEDNSPPPAAPASRPAPSTASVGYTVVKGDTLSGIAARHGVSSAAIKQANGMTSDTVVLGKTLVIPGSSGPVARTAPAAGGKTHTVVKGDTLDRISRKYGVSIEAIKTANGMKSDTVILGSKVRIP